MKRGVHFRIVAVCAVGVAAAAVRFDHARAETCTHDQLAHAVDQAGERLRQLTATTEPEMDAKMQRLKAARGWSEAEFQENGYASLEDSRTAELDAKANELLARIDELGADDPAAMPPDCGRIAEIEAASVELQATVKAKGQYVLARLDRLVGDGSGKDDPGKDGAGKSEAKPSAEATPQAPPPAPPVVPRTPPAAKAPPPKPSDKWATQTTPLPAAPPAPNAPPAGAGAAPSTSASPPPVAPTPPQVAQDEFTIDEIVEASRGPFGKVSANLARVLEHAFATSGRPTGYILGQETGGAFIAGLRYGQGTLYMRDGRSLPVFWHGPSVGADVGAQGAATLFLVYKIHEPGEVFANFTGIEGSAYVVGGVGLTFVGNGKISMAPIRSGVGLRLGANLGYLRFTPKQTWNPF